MYGGRVPLAKGLARMHSAQKPDMWPVPVRYLIGRPLDGLRRTDSTFWTPATHTLGTIDYPSKWAMLPGWKRSAWRLGAPVAAGLSGWGYLTDPTATLVAAGSGTTAGTLYGLFRVYRALRKWRHTRRYTVPLHRNLATVLGVDHASPGDWLDVPEDFTEEDSPGVRVLLPPALPMDPGTKQAIRLVVGQKLGLENPVERYHMVGLKPYAVFRAAPKPPARLPWAMVRDLALKAPEHAPVIGLGCRKVPVDSDLEADSPHVLVSAGSGGGKSVLIRTVLAQGLRRGAVGVVLDFKRSSHSWAKDLPNVLYCRDIEEIHAALVMLGKEGERRNKLSDVPGADIGPRILIVAEEMNATIFKLTEYWKVLEGSKNPGPSPAISGLRDVLFMGRSARMHVAAVAQMMTARTLGGPEARENFATRCLTRYTLNAWKMLTPEVWPAPKRSKIVGRWQIVKAGEAHETQVAFMTDEEAREWALAGDVTPVADVLGVDTHLYQANEVRTVPGTPEPGPDLVTLREASGRLSPAVSLDALRKASTRDDRFPTPAVRDDSGNTGDLYRIDDLEVWKREREARRAAKGAEA